jgi:hypothetical protein
MAETQPTAQPKSTKPGTLWQPGQPIPDGFFVCEHEGGMPTLERVAPEGFDKDLHERVLREVDMAFTRNFKDPSDEHPRGLRPYVLYVNRAFRKVFPNVRMWGDLQPPCEIEIVSDEKRYAVPGAIRIGEVRAVFSTTTTVDDE